MNKSVFLNLDFMPPATEQLLLLPQSAENKGINSLCIKLIDNFPWEFDCRMKSDSSYPDNVVEYFIRDCGSHGVGVEYVFPDIYSFSRLLRLVGYSRMGADLDGLRIINPKAVGFKSLMESVIEDVVSLAPDIKGFLLQKAPHVHSGSGKPGELYNNTVSECINDAGYKIDFIETDTVFIYADKIIKAAEESGLTELFKTLFREVEYCCRAYFKLKEFCVMNTLSCNPPASTESNLYRLFINYTGTNKRVREQIDSFRSAAEKFIEPGWLEHYLRSLKLTIDGDLSDISNRLRQQGFLN